MGEKNEGLKKRISELSDKKLVKMLCDKAQEYTEEALSIARKEAERRGGLDKLCASVGKEYDPTETQDTHPKVEEEEPINISMSDPLPPRTNIPVIPSPSSEVSPPRVITLKEESIRQEWALMIENGAGNAQSMYDDIQKYLQESKIPGGCAWEIVELQSSTWFSKVRRVFLIVNLEQFKDYHIYIGVRDYGIHLDCCYYITIEPGLLKQIAAERMYNDTRALSAPRNILVHQDLRAWVTVVDRAVNLAADAVQIKLGQDPKTSHRGSKGFLDIW